MSVDNNHIGHLLERSQLHDQQIMIKNIINRLNDLQTRTNNHIINNKTCNRASSPYSDHQPDNKKDIATISKKIQQLDQVNEDNLLKLQEHINQNCTNLYSKMKKMQEKFIRLFSEKQQALGYLQLRCSSLENENKNLNILFSKSVNTDKQYKYDAVKLIEDRIGQIQQIAQMREAKQADNLRILEMNLNKSIDDRLQNFEEIYGKQNNDGQQVENSDIQRNVADSSEFADQIKMLELSIKEDKRKLIKVEEDLKSNHQGLEKLKIEDKTMKKKLQNIEKELANLIRNDTHNHDGIHSRNSSEKEVESNMLQRRSGNRGLERHNPMKFQKNQRENSQSQDSYEQINRQTRDIEQMNVNMRGGIRGLLQKSKQKDISTKKKSLDNKTNPRSLYSKPEFSHSHKALPPKKDPFQHLNYPSNPKSLPPVRQDPKHSIKHNKHQQLYQDEQQQRVYNVDEDGYLIDEDGNYMYDQYGDHIRLSEQDLAQLMKQQGL